MTKLQYGILTPNIEGIQPMESLAAASTWAGINGTIFVREVHSVEYGGVSYEEYGRWYEPHCDYCQERGDLSDMAGHLCCPYCWAEVFEALQAEIRWQQIHAHDKAA